MARRSTPRRRTRPDPPIEPDSYDPAPAAGTHWDGVEADGATAVGALLLDALAITIDDDV